MGPAWSAPPDSLHHRTEVGPACLSPLQEARVLWERSRRQWPRLNHAPGRRRAAYLASMSTLVSLPSRMPRRAMAIWETDDSSWLMLPSLVFVKAVCAAGES